MNPINFSASEVGSTTNLACRNPYFPFWCEILHVFIFNFPSEFKFSPRKRHLRVSLFDWAEKWRKKITAKTSRSSRTHCKKWLYFTVFSTLKVLILGYFGGIFSYNAFHRLRRWTRFGNIFYTWRGGKMEVLGGHRYMISTFLWSSTAQYAP